MRIHIQIALLLLATSSGLFAQQPQVESVRALNFGVLFRGMRSVVDYRDPHSAEFVVHGRPGAHVRLMIVEDELSLPTGESMRPKVRSAHCAYSLDHGLSWTEFGNEGLVAHLVFPESSAATSEIRVRVGGDLTVGDEQQRGVYAMRIDLNARYYKPD